MLCQCFNVPGVVQEAVSPAIEYLFGPPFAPGCDHGNPTRHGFHEHHGKRLPEERGKDERTGAPEVRPGVRDETRHEHVFLHSLLLGTFKEVSTFWPFTKNDELQGMISSNDGERSEQVGEPLHPDKASASDDEGSCSPKGRTHGLLRHLPDPADRKRVI